MGNLKKYKHFAIQARQAHAAELFLQHPDWNQQQIADEIGIERTLLNKDLKAIKKKYSESTLRDTNTYVNIELAKLDEREAEAREWLEHFWINEDGDIKEDRYNSKEAVKWMEILLKIADRRAKLLGLDKPNKVEVDANLNHAGSINVKSMSDEELQRAIDDELNKRFDVK